MKFQITEQEKKQILGLYGKKNINESFITNLIPSLKNKIKYPYFVVYNDPVNKDKFRLFVTDRSNPNFRPIDAEKLLGQGEWKYYDKKEDAQKDADIHNNTVSGKSFEKDKFSNLDSKLKKDQSQLEKWNYRIVDKIDLPDGDYYEEGWRIGDTNTQYNPNDPKAFVNKNSNVFKIKRSNKLGEGDTGYAVLTSKLAMNPMSGGKVTIKGGQPISSSNWGVNGKVDVISIHKKI